MQTKSQFIKLNKQKRDQIVASEEKSKSRIKEFWDNK